MLTDRNEMQSEIKSFILDEFLPGEDPDELHHDTPLITGGILDSISTVKLVSYLESQFGVAFQAHEMNADHLNTIDQITATVTSKQR